jgi:hypothetical protein
MPFSFREWRKGKKSHVKFDQTKENPNKQDAVLNQEDGQNQAGPSTQSGHTDRPENLASIPDKDSNTIIKAHPTAFKEAYSRLTEEQRQLIDKYKIYGGESEDLAKKADGQPATKPNKVSNEIPEQQPGGKIESLEDLMQIVTHQNNEKPSSVEKSVKVAEPFLAVLGTLMDIAATPASINPIASLAISTINSVVKVS